MTVEQFKNITMGISEVWGVKFDKRKADTWFRILGNLKPERLLLALDSLVKDPPINPQTEQLELRYAPNPPQIIDRYEQLRRRDTALAREKAIADQQKLLTSQVGGQYQCPICNNTGDVLYERNRYQYHCRCLCARGKDLNRWCRDNLVKGSTWTNPKTGKVEIAYSPDVNDVMSPEEIEIIKSKNLARQELPKPDIRDVKLGVMRELERLHGENNEQIGLN